MRGDCLQPPVGLGGRLGAAVGFVLQAALLALGAPFVLSGFAKRTATHRPPPEPSLGCAACALSAGWGSSVDFAMRRRALGGNGSPANSRV